MTKKAMRRERVRARQALAARKHQENLQRNLAHAQTQKDAARTSSNNDDTVLYTNRWNNRQVRVPRSTARRLDALAHVLSKVHRSFTLPENLIDPAAPYLPDWIDYDVGADRSTDRLEAMEAKYRRHYPEHMLPDALPVKVAQSAPVRQVVPDHIGKVFYKGASEC